MHWWILIPELCNGALFTFQMMLAYRWTHLQLSFIFKLSNFIQVEFAWKKKWSQHLKRRMLRSTGLALEQSNRNTSRDDYQEMRVKLIRTISVKSEFQVNFSSEKQNIFFFKKWNNFRLKWKTPANFSFSFLHSALYYPTKWEREGEIPTDWK